jgi:hypothetical protein
MNPLDQAVKNQQEKKKSAELWAKDILARDVHAPLKSLWEETPDNLRDVEDYLPTFSAVLDKAERSGYASDIEIMSLLQQGKQTLLSNASTIRAGMKKYNELTWRDLLNNRGELDRNAAAKHLRDIRVFLSCGRGCRKSMENTVKRLNSRVAFRMEQERQHGGNGAPPITPPEPEGPGSVSGGDFDSRLP